MHNRTRAQPASGGGYFVDDDVAKELGISPKKWPLPLTLAQVQAVNAAPDSYPDQAITITDDDEPEGPEEKPDDYDSSDDDEEEEQEAAEDEEETQVRTCAGVHVLEVPPAPVLGLPCSNDASNLIWPYLLFATRCHHSPCSHACRGRTARRWRRHRP